MKVPPVLAVALAGGLAWLIARAGDPVSISSSARLTFVVLFVAAALLLDGWAIASFRRARTTVNPLKPDPTALVTTGVYRRSRNPMYLGMVLFLLAWCTYLGDVVALFAVPALAAYLTRFQIVPEERVLADRFGLAFDDYRDRVPRWI